MQEDRKAAYTPAARYYVKECSKDKLVLSREEVNMGGPNLIEGDVTYEKSAVISKEVAADCFPGRFLLSASTPTGVLLRAVPVSKFIVGATSATSDADTTFSSGSEQ